jgi:hypothetical protein
MAKVLAARLQVAEASIKKRTPTKGITSTTRNTDKVSLSGNQETSTSASMSKMKGKDMV